MFGPLITLLIPCCFDGVKDPPWNPNTPQPRGAFPQNAASAPNEHHRGGGWRARAKLLIRALRNLVGKVRVGLVTAGAASVGEYQECVKIFCHAGLCFYSKAQRDCLECRVSLCSARGALRPCTAPRLVHRMLEGEHFPELTAGVKPQSLIFSLLLFSMPRFFTLCRESWITPNYVGIAQMKKGAPAEVRYAENKQFCWW